MESILELRGLSKQYGSLMALRNVTLTLPKGRIIGLLGPNGSGKTTMIKLISGLLTPTSGMILVDQKQIGEETKALISYLPDQTYLSGWMKVSDCLDYFADFYSDFDRQRAIEMLTRLSIPQTLYIKSMSKGTKEKMQLVLVMSRRAKLYLLDEPIGGVDPATRDYILDTILSNYHPESTILISTHLISDVERILDEFIFLKDGMVTMHEQTDTIRETQGKSLDELFREVFKC
ncbi:MAG: ABC transporter ATP-binding protein [Clostridia bacterium]